MNGFKSRQMSMIKLPDTSRIAVSEGALDAIVIVHHLSSVIAELRFAVKVSQT